MLTVFFLGINSILPPLLCAVHKHNDQRWSEDSRLERDCYLNYQHTNQPSLLIPNPSFQSDQFIFQTFVKQPTTWNRDDDSGKLEENARQGHDDDDQWFPKLRSQLWSQNVNSWRAIVHIQNVLHPARRATIITHVILESWDQIIKIFDN